MIRSRDEFYERLFAGLQLLASLLIFNIGLWFNSLLPGKEFAWELIAIVLSFLAAWLLPSFLFGRPTLHVKWRLEGAEYEGGNPLIDLRTPDPAYNGANVNFETRLVASYRSVLGYVILRRLTKQGTVVLLKPAPPGIVRFKKQNAQAASIQGLVNNRYLQFELTKPKHETEQSRFTGSFLRSKKHDGHEDEFQFYAELRAADGKERHVIANVVSGIDKMRVRS